MSYEKLFSQVQEESQEIINSIHNLSNKIWKNITPIEIQNICMNAWDDMRKKIGSHINPLIPVREDYPITNLIFGSGSFSTGRFQAQQFQKVKNYLENPPVVLQGIVSNKSQVHGCNGSEIAKEFKIPNINVDYNDWYHENINRKEDNPIRATRYWYPPGQEKSIDMQDVKNRFNIRQIMFHKTLGEQIAKFIMRPTDIVSARGYNFQFCSCIFSHQEKNLPHINDTHPADLTYVDPHTKAKLYVGWQAGATKMMIEDDIKHLRGSLIEVDYMDKIEQIHKLDEGALLAIGYGIHNTIWNEFTPSEIQNLIKIMDDYLFCTLEPTGLLLLWGITENSIPITYQDIKGNPVEVKQKAIVVGNKLLSGIEAFGYDIKNNLKEIEEFLLVQKVIS